MVLQADIDRRRAGGDNQPLFGLDGSGLDRMDGWFGAYEVVCRPVADGGRLERENEVGCSRGPAAVSRVLEGCAKYWYQEGKSFKQTRKDLAACQAEAMRYSDVEESQGLGTYDGKFVRRCMEEQGYHLVGEKELPAAGQTGELPGVRGAGGRGNHRLRNPPCRPRSGGVGANRGLPDFPLTGGWPVG